MCLEKKGRELGMYVIGGNVKLDMLKISVLRASVVEDWNSEWKDQCFQQQS